MKIPILYLISMLIFSFIGCESGNKIKNIKVSYIDWDIDSPIRIQCNDLKNYQKSLVTIDTSDKTFCRSIAKELRLITEIETTDEPDVRIRLDILFQNDSESILCLGNNEVMEYNGKIVKYNKRLLALIREYIDKEH